MLELESERLVSMQVGLQREKELGLVQLVKLAWTGSVQLRLAFGHERYAS